MKYFTVGSTCLSPVSHSLGVEAQRVHDFFKIHRKGLGSQSSALPVSPVIHMLAVSPVIFACHSYVRACLRTIKSHGLGFVVLWTRPKYRLGPPRTASFLLDLRKIESLFDPSVPPDSNTYSFLIPVIQTISLAPGSIVLADL